MKYIIHICVFDLKRNKNFQKFSNTIKHTKRKERIGKVSQCYSRRSEPSTHMTNLLLSDTLTFRV